MPGSPAPPASDYSRDFHHRDAGVLVCGQGLIGVLVSGRFRANGSALGFVIEEREVEAEEAVVLTLRRDGQSLGCASNGDLSLQ